MNPTITNGSDVEATFVYIAIEEVNFAAIERHY